MSENVSALIVTQFFPPESMGGAHRWERIAANLDDDIDPHVLTTQPTFPFGQFEQRWTLVDDETVSGVEVTRLFTYQPTRDSVIGRTLNYCVFALVSTAYVLATFWRYDCIVTMSAPHTTFVPGLVGKITGRTWIIDIFDLWIDNAADLGYVDEQSVLHRTVDRLEFLSFRMSDRVLVITDTMAGYYEEKYGSVDPHVQVVPFGVDTEMFSPTTDREFETDIIYTGNLGTGQAFTPFLKGFAMLGDDAELTILGDGERRDELESLCKELGIEQRVDFRGYVDRAQIPGYLAGAKASIVPLKTEIKLDYARPTKLLESMAVGTPYVASNVAEISKLSRNEATGFAVSNDPEAIHGSLRRLLAESELRRRLGRNGIEYIEKNHAWESIAKQVSTALRTEGVR